jgi:ribosomal 50S subunit-recycling heat shock protein
MTEEEKQALENKKARSANNVNTGDIITIYFAMMFVSIIGIVIIKKIKK